MESKQTKEESLTKEVESTFGAFFSAEPVLKLRYVDIRKRVLQRFNEDAYAQLKQDIQSYGLTTDGVGKFFLKEGRFLLRWALIDATSNKPLKFFKEEVPTQALQKVLSQDDFSVFKSFLLVQAGLEKMGWYNKVKEERQIEKFKALLAIDSEGITNFVEKNTTNKNIVSDRIKENFDNVLKQFKEENSSIEQTTDKLEL